MNNSVIHVVACYFIALRVRKIVVVRRWMLGCRISSGFLSGGFVRWHRGRLGKSFGIRILLRPKTDKNRTVSELSSG